VMDIKNIYDAVIFSSAAITLRDAVLEAIGKKISLSSADLRSANLRSADLRYADLSSANLRSANLSSAKNSELAMARIQFIPATGAFIGWEKCLDERIVKLAISASAKRSHGAERKCRCSKAKTLEIWSADGKPLDEAISLYDSNFVYRKGKVVEVANFDEDRWNVCGAGIHFYLTRLEAEAHD